MTQRPAHGGNLAWAAQIAACSPDRLLDFSASISPLGPPPTVLAAIQASLAQLVSYPDPAYGPLRAQIAAVHDVSPDWVLPGNGAAELLTWACRDFTRGFIAGCGLPVPAFGDYGRSLTSFKIPLYPIPLLTDGQWQFDLADLGQVIPAGAGILLNNPHNPTGHLWPRSRIAQCLETFPLVVVDEAFMDFLPPDQQQSVVGWSHEHLVVLRSLTKFYSIPGLRIGYAVAHPDRLRRWQRWRDPWPVNVLAAAAAVAALQDTAFQQRTWDWLGPARSALLAQLQTLPGLTPLAGAANFLLVGCQVSVAQLQLNLLRRHQVYIRDCLSFAALGDRYFRVAVRSEADNQRLVAALRTELASDRP